MEEVKITKEQILDFDAGLGSVRDLPGAKFSYAVARNVKSIESEVQAYNEAVKPSEKFAKFMSEKAKLLKKLAKKDEKGLAVRDGDSYAFDKPVAEVEAEVAKLAKKYKKAIDEEKKKLKELEDVLKEEVSIQVYKVDFEEVPEEIKPEQMVNIILMVNQPD